MFGFNASVVVSSYNEIPLFMYIAFAESLCKVLAIPKVIITVRAFVVNRS